MLSQFLLQHREELLALARMRVARRAVEPSGERDLHFGLPAFFDQLQQALSETRTQAAAADHGELLKSAIEHGQDLFRRGMTVTQVVQDYGDLCQVITGLAIERETPISGRDFQTLNLCLDKAIAGAVTEYGRQRERALTSEGAERLGVLAHEMRNLLNTAMLAFASLKQGTVGVGGSTGAVLERSLTGLASLIDRSFAAVRLEGGVAATEAVSVHDVVEEVVIGASLFAQSRGIPLVVTSLDGQVLVLADGQILAAAITNLLHNAFKFTHAGTSVLLRASATDSRVLIEVEDECGGLPRGRALSLLRPFVQRGEDRSGLGLGLSICVKAVQSMDGELRIRDLPGKGCVFTIDLPRHTPEPTITN